VPVRIVTGRDGATFVVAHGREHLTERRIDDTRDEQPDRGEGREHDDIHHAVVVERQDAEEPSSGQGRSRCAAPAGGRHALVAMCIGGGQGIAAVFERA
jgi:hypothetical protein